MIACDVTVLPEPDSPTMASVRPGWRSKDSPSTARKRPPGTGKSTVSERTDSNGCAVGTADGLGGAALEAGMEGYCGSTCCRQNVDKMWMSSRIVPCQNPYGRAVWRRRPA